MTATIQFKGSGYVFTTVGTLEQKLKDERDRLARERITDPPARWELTHAGRSALQLTT
jgi:hypothetical protein